MQQCLSESDFADIGPPDGQRGPSSSRSTLIDFPTMGCKTLEAGRASCPEFTVTYLAHDGAVFDTVQEDGFLTLTLKQSLEILRQSALPGWLHIENSVRVCW